MIYQKSLMNSTRQSKNCASNLTKTPATAPNRRQQTALRKRLKVCVRKAVRNAAVKKDIRELISLFFPRLMKSSGICTPTVLPVLIGTSARKKPALRKHATSLMQWLKSISPLTKSYVSKCALFAANQRQAILPKDVKANVQYGNNLQALVVAFNTIGEVSVNRIHEILGGIFNIPLSTGTIKNIVSRCAEKIKPALETIRSKLSESPLVHCDETGTNIDGKLHWVHNVSNGNYTYMTVSKKRGYEGIKSVGVLPDYRGIVVHDSWASYWKFDDVTHSVCCAHLLRELNGIMENHPEQTWAGKFKKLLLRMKRAKDKAIAAGKEALSVFTIQKYKREYDNIIKDAYGENPERVNPKKKRGRVKRGKILALIDRLQKYKGAVCLFIEKLSVPFDNNQAERDIRNIKTKTKVCGCFRSRTGAEEYLDIMSFISTARKNGFDSYHAVKMALLGQINLFWGWGAE